MSSEIKSDGKTLGGKQLDTTAKILNTPKYRWQRIIPQSGAQFLNLAPSSQGECTFELPQKVFNLSQSVLSWTRTIADQGAGVASWSFQNTPGELYQIQLYSRNSVMLVDLPNANVYLKIARPRSMKLDDFLSGDANEVVYKSDLPAALNPIPVAALGSQTATTNYTEQKYLLASPIGVGAAGTGFQEQRVDFRLGNLVDTMFAADKDVLFGEIMVVRCVFQSNKVGFTSTSTVNPATGNGLLVSGAASSPTTGGAAGANFCVYISGLTLYLACEDRDDVKKEMWSKLDKGYTMVVPYVWAQKDNLTGTSVTQSQKLAAEHGKFLRKAIHTVMAANETGITAFDHSNLPTTPYANPPVGSKLTQYHTEIDGSRIQDQDMWSLLTPPIGQPNDYLEQKRQLKGSVIEGRQQYYLNWSWVDNFTYENPSDGMCPSDALGGLALTGAQRKYDFVVTSAPGVGALNHYTFFVCARVMRVTTSGVDMNASI